MSDLETRLLEFWKADAAIWRDRTGFVWNMVGGEPSKIDIAKVHSQAQRLVSDKKRRIADGNPLVRKVRGTMILIETGDDFHAPKFACVVCGKPFTSAIRVRRPPLYCSPACNMAAFRMREAS